MKLVVLMMLAACGDKPTTGPVLVRNTAVSVTQALPTDAEMGELAIVPSKTRDNESWLPQGPGPLLVEAVLREGNGPAPSWLATDRAGTSSKLTYGTTAHVPYGCDGNTMAVTMLEGDGSKLSPGLLWLRPIAQAAWMPKPVAIVGAKLTPTRRDLTIGAVSLEIVRTEARRGVVNVLRDQRMIHQMTFERSDMEGADNDTPIDLVDGGPGVPTPEMAWSFGAELLAIVFKVPGYEGLAFKTIVVNAERGRTVAAMALYLYQCAF